MQVPDCLGEQRHASVEKRVVCTLTLESEWMEISGFSPPIIADELSAREECGS